jgi:ectoine hydroxylase-related dioxygenase (phytanoyl-CoA dioxygenase family)
MDNPHEVELETLRAELKTLRLERENESATAPHTHRLHERDLEYQHRRLELELAADGIKPVGVTPEAPVHGASEFVGSLQSVDIDRVLSVVEEMHQNGYAIVPDLLSQEQVERIRDTLAPLYAGTAGMFKTFDHPHAGHQTIHVQNVLAKTDGADEIATNPLLRAIVGGVLGHDFIMNAGAVAMSPDPGCSPQGLHRDDGFFALIPRPHMPLVLTIAVALDDFTAENGGTQLIPGSCCWPDSRQPQDEEIILCEMAAGSMLLWDGAIYHGGGGNTTQLSRRTLTLNYTRGWLRTQFNQYLSVPRDRVLSMAPELQADLGYHRSAIGLGGCDYQDPLKYLQTLTDEGGDGAQNLLGRENA